jgi:hypothetical protein
MKRFFLILFLSLFPTIAQACPMCNAGSTDQTLKIIGAFLLLPFIVFSLGLLAYRIILKKETLNR